MNTSHEIPQQPPTPQLKPRFYDVALMLELDYHELQQIAKDAGIDEGVMNDMFLSVAVHRVDAEKYLAAFSRYTKQTWTLNNNVRVALLPTFANVCAEHQDLDFTKIVSISGVEYAVLLQMTTCRPVLESNARLILRALSQEAKRHYGLENVDVAIIRER